MGCPLESYPTREHQAASFTDQGPLKQANRFCKRDSEGSVWVCPVFCFGGIFGPPYE